MKLRRSRLAVAPTPGAAPVTCRGPAVSLHFSIAGTVHACCENGTYLLGDVRTDTIEEIWHGAARREMAAALAAGDYPLGCRLCEVEHALGNRASTPAPPFDGLAEGEWPSQLEFTLSNRCNLACVQCSGWNSSTIRKGREGLPPLPMPYGEAFFDQLGPFLDHVDKVTFLGGEPFLTPQAKRVWDMIRDRGLQPEVQVTTNATVWSDEVERYVHDLRMDFAISMDGATATTYEAIRVGARWDRFVTIRDRLVEATRSYGGRAQINWCLMPANVHEVGLLLLQADELDVVANVIPVHEPEAHSLFALGDDELAAIVERLEDEDRVLRPRLGRNLGVWDDLRRMLGDQARRREDRVRREAAVRAAALVEEERLRSLEAAAAAELTRWAGGRGVITVTVVDGRIVDAVAPAWAGVLGVDRWVGAEPEALFDLVGEVLGPVVRVTGDLPAGADDDGEVVYSRCRTQGEGAPVEFLTAWLGTRSRLLIVARDDLAPA